MTAYKHFLVTNRLAEDGVIVDADRQFSKKDELNFGEIEFSDQGNITELYPVEGDSVDYRDCLTKAKEELKGSARLFRELYEAVESSDKEILLVIHGYYHTYKRLQKTASLIHRAHVMPEGSNIGHLLLFSWPAGDQLDEYEKDQTSAKCSGRHFGKFISEWASFLNEAFGDDDSDRAETFAAKMNMVVASMGNQLLESFASQYEYNPNFKEKLFKDVILTAADIDRDAFDADRPLSGLLDIADQVLCHFNYADNLLLLSETIGGNSPRLGKWGPTRVKEGLDNLTFLDVAATVLKGFVDPELVFSKDTPGYPIDHAYFTRLKRVAEDSQQVFHHIDKADTTGRVKLGKDKYYLCIGRDCLKIKSDLDIALENFCVERSMG